MKPIPDTVEVDPDRLMEHFDPKRDIMIDITNLDYFEEPVLPEVDTNDKKVLQVHRLFGSNKTFGFIEPHARKLRHKWIKESWKKESQGAD